MKSFRARLYYMLLFFTIICKSQSQVEAHLIGTTGWIKGNYVEIGINEQGVYGANIDLKPNSFHSNRITNGLFGFIANPQADGWLDYDGDFFVPGNPEEGFCLEINGINYNNNNNQNLFQISGGITQHSTINSICEEDISQLTWEGEIHGVKVTRYYEVTANGLFIKMTMVLENIGATVKNDVYFMHNVDPDNNQILSSVYETQMDLIAQATSITDKVSLVKASQSPLYTTLDMDGSFISFYAEDARARVTYGGFGNRSASNIWNGIGVTNIEGASSPGPIDRAISIAFKVGDLQPSQTVSFEYFYVFGDINQTFTPDIDSINFSYINATTCNPGNGQIDISGLDPNTNYNIQYTHNGSLIPEATFSSDSNGLVKATGLGAGLYSDFSISDLGCVINLNTEITLLEPDLPQVNPVSDQVFCDDDSDYVIMIDLSQFNNTVLGTQSSSDYDISYHDTIENLESNIALPYSYLSSGEPLFQVFAKITDRLTGCYNYTTFNITIGKSPEVQLIDQLICLNTDSTVNLDYELPVIDTMLSNIEYTFKWFYDGVEIVNENKSFLVITREGNYMVEVKEVTSSCFYTFDTTILATAPPHQIEVNVTSQPFSNNHTVEIIASGISDYEYRVDNGAYQPSSMFTNLNSGYHKVTVRDINGCGFETANFVAIDYPKFFTPNGDSFNDYWQIYGIEELSSPSTFIFNRYGKLLKQLNPRSRGWDGIYNGQKMPASDYWFKVVFEDRDNIQREFTAHFTLKR